MNSMIKWRLQGIVFLIACMTLITGVLISSRFPLVNADNLPVEYVGGTLVEDTTWHSDTVYLITSGLTIPDDITLTVEAGTAIKFSNWNPRYISVPSGGTLNANGTSTDRITFTSYADDAVGGDTNGDGSNTSPQRNEYTSAIQSNGGTVNLSYANLRYASTAVQMYGAVNVSTSYVVVYKVSSAFDLNVDVFSGDHIEIEDVNTGIVTGSGKVILSNSSISKIMSAGIAASGSSEVVYRGNFSEVDNYAITSCRWDQDCSVDAAYVDWGNTDGAHPSSGPLICGRVSRVPWMYNSTTYNSGLGLFVSSCDNAPTPEQQLSSAIAGYQSRRSQHYVDCATIPDACDQAALMYSCLTSGVDIATSIYPIPGMPTLSDNSTSIGSYGSMAAQAGLNYVIAGSTQTASGASPTKSRFTGIMNVFTALINGYNSCG